jgi:hypothetical protein
VRCGRPDASGQVVVDIDGVLVLAHPEKQDAAATWKRTFGRHPLVTFVDHGREGSGEPVAGLLRPGNAGSNTPPTTSPPPGWPWPSYRNATGADAARWSAPTRPTAPTSSWTG